MIKKPNFFIIGAPKCGTTSLVEYLRSHPDVFFCTPKEPHHFCTDLSIVDNFSDDEYLDKYFSQITTEIAIGEGSTHYLYSRDAVKNILAVNPDAKFIIMVRNPVEMAESLYYEERSQLVETASSFEKAWEQQQVPYAEMCKVGKQLERFFSLIPDKSRTLIINFHEFVQDPKTAYHKTLIFLGLPEDTKTNFENAHPRQEPRSRFLELVLYSINSSRLKSLSLKIKTFLGIEHWPFLGNLHNFLRKINLRKAKKKEMSPALKQCIENYFKEDIALINTLTGINL